MLSASARFQAAMRESHRVTVQATIYPPTGSPVVAEVISGQVRADRDSRARRSGSLTVAFDLAANVAFVRELPFGGYVKLERGVLFADGTVERMQLGYLRVNTVSWNELEGQATLELVDRFAQVQEQVFQSPRNMAGVKPTFAIIDLVDDVFGSDIDYNVLTDPANETVLTDAIYDQDRGQAVGDLASGIGATAYFDVTGDFVLKPNPGEVTDATPPDWTFDVGAGGTLEVVQESLDRSAVRNGIALKGQTKADKPPFYTLVSDDDPASPTRWGGPFGKVPLLVSLTGMQSKTQAKATGDSLLRLRLGLARTVTLRGVPMPALEPDDVVRVHYLDGREENLLVNAVTMPLDVTASMEVVVTGHYRPETLAARRHRRASAVAGPAAWREVDEVSA